jgi:hypothetical protein
LFTLLKNCLHWQVLESFFNFLLGSEKKRLKSNKQNVKRGYVGGQWQTRKLKLNVHEVISALGHRWEDGLDIERR